MTTFSFSRKDFWVRRIRIWYRKHILRCIGSPIMTLSLLCLIIWFSILSHHPSSSTTTTTTTTTTTQYDISHSHNTLRTTKSSSSMSKNPNVANTFIHPKNQALPKGVIVLLAPPRNATSIWDIDRFCLLRRAVRSIDQNLNALFGPYPIMIIVAKDYMDDPRHMDDIYTERDRALIEKWIQHTNQIIWQEVDMYTNTALEPGTTQQQIIQWRHGHDGGQAGRDIGYQSMCRLWSGRLQNMDLLNDYDYYMRIDDDSLLTLPLQYDPFLEMRQQNISYVYRRLESDHWGIDKLWNIAKPYVLDPKRLPCNVKTRQLFLITNNYMVGPSWDDEQGDEIDESQQQQRRQLEDDDDTADEKREEEYVYDGIQPYNNFHISKLDFWRSTLWQQFMMDMDRTYVFQKYRVGDANVHAMAIMMMGDNNSEQWYDFPYVHNSNDMGYDWGKKEWKQECEQS